MRQMPFRQRKESVDVFLQLTDKAAVGRTCFGDSGCANVIGSTNVIAAANSFVVNSQCAG
jgi:hypothetical protein